MKQGWIEHSLPGQVELLDPYLKHAFSLEREYLLALKADRLLAGFRETAGLSTKGALRYGGWENGLIGGHTMGHFLSAISRAAVSGGVSPEERQALTEKTKYVIDALQECQEHSKGEKGFLFGGTLTDPSHVEGQFDCVQRGEADIWTQAWVPWYTMHKILAGILDVYKNMAYEPALQVAVALGNWVCNRALSWDEEVRRQVLAIEYGGMNDVLYELYDITGEERFAKAAHVFDEEELFRRVASGEKDVLNNVHANTTIPKFQGAIHRYLSLREKKERQVAPFSSGENGFTQGKTGESRQAEQDSEITKYLEYARCFWDLVVEQHTYLTGGNSEWEHFGKDGILNEERTSCNNETCNVYNMLKLSQSLFFATGEKKYLEYFETGWINAILASQNPETGMTTYFQPMANGYFKVYSHPFDNFWCCTGTGMENFTRLGDGIYYPTADGLVVALFVSSTFSCEKRGFTLTQEADLEHSDMIRFTIEKKGAEEAGRLYLRIPEWIEGEPELSARKIVSEDKLLGSEFAERENGFLILDLSRLMTGEEKADAEIRKFTLELTLKKSLRVKGLPDAPQVLGLTYGPYVLSADLGEENMEETVTGVEVRIPKEPCSCGECLYWPPMETEEKRRDARFVFEADRGKLVFEPHYRKHNRRYGLYWNFIQK